ncbi:sn-glycerol-3-phosphate ABC transporter ATP-binding protein UgpC [Rhizobium sp. P38BS-XIX]|uniref:ABC transporter ATP-binding protein n=1 Tax=Rhizobium sp. P38BS-XIX TaxID=2726740 RepID=UPI0014575D03|nr:sn-glycerol-3-phosphate ABC transporter ATP-binding protein UgpC [Rhizobium sp. P38BS-XIX]NLS01722.1 sn-glycerol-3-phosphate ABC transporter ATP-binding protein UgpC [Rhizobium sp. P38BS-XIX]
MSQVEISNVRKSYGALEILHGVSLDIEDGKFVVLVGPSGCGKSTLLRMIAGLEDITSGDIVIGSQRMNDVQPKDRNIAMVFQSYALYPHMTVAENMSFSLRLKKESSEKVEREVKRAAEILGLTPLLPRYPRQLSGGQRQRVAMGRAIVRNPQVFLFDEPLSNLDAKLRVQMRGEIKQLHQRLGTTTVYVTHDQIEAMTMADEIVVMKDGKIEQRGAPLTLYDRPETVFVASFIGSPSMNLLDGEIASRDDGHGVLLTDGTFLPLDGDWSRHAGRRVIYGIRPEDISLGRSDLAVRVDVIEPTGPETQLLGAVGQDKVTILLKSRVGYAPGEVVRFAIDRGRAHVFDAEGGHRLSIGGERAIH